MSGLTAGRWRSARYRILLLNLALLALFVWALAETTTLQIEVIDGICTAILGDSTNSVPCPDLGGGQVGLYNTADPEQPTTLSYPWRLILPDSSWRALAVSGVDGSNAVELLKAGRPETAASDAGDWRTLAGELQPLTSQAAILWANPLADDFRLQADLRRPVDNAGLLLLQPGGTDGWLFLFDSATRLGTWWRWQAGQPVEPLLGAPLQKSLLAQSQSLIRRILLGHQAGLLLLLASWLLALILAWTARRLRREPEHSAQHAAPSGERGDRDRIRDRAILVTVLLLVFAGALFIAGDRLGGIPHVQDSITYRFQAQTLARGHLTAPAPPEPEAFSQEFMLVNNGRWFGKYPPGYPLLLAAGERFGMPWLVNPLLATLTVALLFALGRAWYGRRVGRLTTLLALVSPFFLIMSATFMAHSAELFWITLFMLAWTRVVQREAASQAGQDGASRAPWLIVAGIAIGMVFLTRQLTALTVAAPFALVTTVAQPGHVSWRRRLKDLLLLTLVAAPFGVMLLLYQGVVTGDPFQDPRLLFWSYDHLGFGQDIGQSQNVVTYATIQGEEILVWQHDPSQPPRGHTPARGVFNLERNWRHLQSHLFGWLPVFTLAFAWLVFALGRARRIDWVLLITAVSLMIGYVFYWADGVSFGPRYLYAALPALLLLVARGIQSLADWLAGRAGQWAVGLILAAFIAGGLLFYFPAVLAELEGYNFVSGANVAAIEAAISEPALVFVVSENGDWWEYGNTFIANTPWLDGRVIYARDLGPAANARLQAHYQDRTAYQLQGERLQRLTPIDH